MTLAEALKDRGGFRHHIIGVLVAVDDPRSEPIAVIADFGLDRSRRWYLGLADRRRIPADRLFLRSDWPTEEPPQASDAGGATPALTSGDSDDISVATLADVRRVMGDFYDA